MAGTWWLGVALALSVPTWNNTAQRACGTTTAAFYIWESSGQSTWKRLQDVNIHFQEYLFWHQILLWIVKWMISKLLNIPNAHVWPKGLVALHQDWFYMELNAKKTQQKPPDMTDFTDCCCRFHQLIPFWNNRYSVKRENAGKRGRVWPANITSSIFRGDLLCYSGASACKWKERGRGGTTGWRGG